MTSQRSLGVGVDAVLAKLPVPASHVFEASMLPRECYTSPEFFEFEKQTVFAYSWVCIGRVEQIPSAGNYLAVDVGDEPVFVVRGDDGYVRAMSAVCRHRGQVMSCQNDSSLRAFRCPVHFWTYDFEGRLTGAPRVGGAVELDRLRREIRLPQFRVELWHGFIFINLDRDAAPLIPSLNSLEAFWNGYEEADLVAIPPVPANEPVPWNWKIQLENFTDAYHPEFVHRGTHDFAPSVHKEGGVEFVPMNGEDNAIVRTVPLLQPDGGMTSDGWGAQAAFPAITTLSSVQRNRLVLAMVPPGLCLMFAPGTIAYTLLRPFGVEATLASSDRVTGGGWLLPRSTVYLSDFAARAAAVREGASKIWAQDVPVNTAMQAGKRSRFMPAGYYGPLETTLRQFNAWLLRRYRLSSELVR